MHKKTRFFLFLFFFIAYLIVAPLLIIYSLGYRLDIKNREIVSTGGVDLTIWPSGATVLVDNQPYKTTNFFSDEIFVQGLAPNFYNISVTKDGYFDWGKKLKVMDKEVTRIDNVTLIKKQIPFSIVKSGITNFIVSSDNKKVLTESPTKDGESFISLDLKSKSVIQTLNVTSKVNTMSWSEDSQNFFVKNQNQIIVPLGASLGIKDINKDGMLNIYLDPRNNTDVYYQKGQDLFNTSSYDQTTKTYLPIIKNVISYKIYQNQIYWLSQDGILNASNLAGQMNTILSPTPLSINTENSYTLSIYADIIFLKVNKALYIFDDPTKTFQEIQNPINNFELSPDKTKILYLTDHQISFAYLSNLQLTTLIYKSSDKINNCFWLNNFNIVLTDGQDIKFSEIDVRDKTNVETIPNKIIFNDKTSLDIKDPSIYFDDYTKQLYILTDGTLLESEKLTQ